MNAEPQICAVCGELLPPDTDPCMFVCQTCFDESVTLPCPVMSVFQAAEEAA